MDIESKIQSVSKGVSLSPVKKEIAELSNILNPNEVISAIFIGVLKGKVGNHLVTLTEQRVIILYNGIAKTTRQIIPLDNISSIQATTGMMFGTVEITSGSDKYVFETGSKELAKEMANKYLLSGENSRENKLNNDVNSINNEINSNSLNHSNENELKIKSNAEIKPNKKKNTVKILLGIIAVIIAIGVLLPEPTAEQLAEREKAKQEKLLDEQKKNAEKILKEIEGYDLESYTKFSDDKRLSILTALINSSDLLNDADLKNVKLFMSEMSYTKNKSLKVKDVFGWAEMEKKNSPDEFNKHVDLIRFMEDFSGWDGSYRPLEKLIKANMNDPKSYEHVKTTYRQVLSSEKKDFKPYAIVSTTFRGKNAFGGVVTNQVNAQVDLQTLEMQIVE